MKTSADYRMPCSVAFVAALLYFSFLAARYNVDGVACAIAVELGDLGHLVHGNHLAYGFLGYIWFLVLKTLGYGGPALQSLQAFSSLLGAAGVGVFSLILLNGGLNPWLAGIGALGLAVSSIYWMWSLEAQVYPLGAVFLFWTAAEALRKRPDPKKLGVLHAGAVLGHIGHIMFLPVALYLLRDAKARRNYLTFLAGSVLIAYAAAAVFCIHPKTLEDVKTWLLGSAALRVDKKFQWHGGYSFFGFEQWIGVSLRILGGNLWIGLLGAVLAAGGAIASWNKRPKLVRACLLWLACYAALYLSWEPFTSVYRITDLAPLWVLMVLAFDSLSYFYIGVLFVAVILLGAWNFKHDIYPNSLPERNAILQRSLWLSRATPENAWIAAESADQVYLPYFAHRKPLNLRYFEGREEMLTRRIASLESQGEPVFAAPETLSPIWRQRFFAMVLQEKGKWNGYVLYQIRAEKLLK